MIKRLYKVTRKENFKHDKNPRIIKLRSLLIRQRIDAFIVSLPANITYLTNYISRDSYLLVSKEKNVYFTDSRYAQEAQDSLGRSFGVTQVNGALFESIARLCDTFDFKTVGFEEEYLPYIKYRIARKKLSKKIGLIPTKDFVEELREVKSNDELKKIREAAVITVRAMKFIKNLIAPGKREIEIVGELERFIRYEGSSGASFDIIVASGPHSSFPHHRSSGRKINNNEPVLIDIGVEYQGYKSDLTRVFFLGKINTLTRRIYDIVLKAQIKALQKIRPSVTINKIDAAARTYIAQKGYGKFFGHSLGHGVGLEIHEAPQISHKENKELKEGMVFTIEPGIYLPGKFGIRIEDMVLVTKNGMEVISGALDK